MAEALALRISREIGPTSSVHEWDRENLLVSCQTESVDVLVMEIIERDPSVFEMPRLLDRHKLSTRVLMLSSIMTDALIQRGLDTGMPGMVSKRQPFGVLDEGIRTVHAGKRFHCPETSERIAKTRCTREKSAGTSGPALLTERETETVKLISQGLSTEAIARVAKISPETVESHQSRIMRKLDLPNRIELARFAFRQGIAQP
jgi:DNA-binding NarL/FixJ family response regulator